MKLVQTDFRPAAGSRVGFDGNRNQADFQVALPGRVASHDRHSQAEEVIAPSEQHLPALVTSIETVVPEFWQAKTAVTRRDLRLGQEFAIPAFAIPQFGRE